MKLKFEVSHKLEKRDTTGKVKEVLFKCMLKMHELAVMNCPVDTGRLRSSIILFPMTPGYTDYTLSDGVDYGIHVEYGTSPHYVSPENLKGWVRRVLGKESAAYAVSWKIARHGVEAQPFFRPALDQTRKVWIKRYWQTVFG